jgi:phosphoribosyl-AMP cyclohydrolase
MNIVELIDWKKCPNAKVPVVIQRSQGMLWGVAWLGADELQMMLQLKLAFAVCRKKTSRFFIDCDGDALLFVSGENDCDQFWMQYPSVDWSFCMQSPHDVRMLLQPQSLWETSYEGLLPAIVQDHVSDDVLMIAWINREAWADCMLSGAVCFFSRSKNRLWRKGEESGNRQVIKECQVCAGSSLPPSIIFRVEQVGGAACHDGYRSCFYRRIEPDGSLIIVGERVFDPLVVYKKECKHD